MAKRFYWTPRPPREDPRNTGVGFVDVLFAVVVGKVLDRSVDGHLPLAGKTQLILAAVLTITSWVGYHNSGNRGRYFLRFVNWPLVQFAIDIGLVYVYWLTAAYAETAPTSSASGRHVSALPESILVCVAAALYVLWDLVAWRIRCLPDYVEQPKMKDEPARRWVSVALLLVSGITLAIVAWSRTTSEVLVVTVDALLLLLLILYRVFKEVVTHPDAFTTRPPSVP